MGPPDDEDVFALSDAEIEAKLRERGVDVDAHNRRLDDLIASALAEGERRRTPAAKRGRGDD